jgi:cytochrome c556
VRTTAIRLYRFAGLLKQTGYLHALSRLAILALLAGCGGAPKPEETLCKDEITRKALASEMTVETTTFSDAVKDSEGNDVLAGKADIMINNEKKMMPFSCVMQGTGAEAVIIRTEFNYSP